MNHESTQQFLRDETSHYVGLKKKKEYKLSNIHSMHHGRKLIRNIRLIRNVTSFPDLTQQDRI
jgi:hypothetical protein